MFVGNFIISYLFDFEGRDEEEKYNSLLLFMAHLDLQTSQNHYQHLKTLSQKIYQLLLTINYNLQKTKLSSVAVQERLQCIVINRLIAILIIDCFN